MSQGVLIGLLCSLLIPRKHSLIDDFLGASLMGCVLMLVWDFYFASLLGYSLLDELPDVLPNYFMSETMHEILFYLTIAAVPIGTTLIVYIGSLLFGKRLGLLNVEGEKKYYQVRQFMRLKPYLCASSWVMMQMVILLVISLSIDQYVYGTYMRALLKCTQVIICYFLIMDLSSFIVDYLLRIKRQVLLTRLFGLGFLVGLIYDFKWTLALTIGIGTYLEYRYHLRSEKQEHLQILLEHMRGLGQRRTSILDEKIIQ